MGQTTLPSTYVQKRQRAQLLSPQMSEKIIHAISFTLLVAGAILVSVPFLWLVSTSLKPADQIFAWPPVWIPKTFMWSNFAAAWNYAPFNLYLLNTSIITGINIFGTVLTSSLVAFGFARLRFPGRDALFLLVLSTMMLPWIVTMIPIFVIFSKLNWVNSILPLVVGAFFGGGAFNIFLLRQFFRTIPRQLEDAARMDGASTLRIWWSVILPLSGPALATVGIFCFLYHWNDFIGPLLYLTDQSKFTLSIGLTHFLSEHGAQWDLLMAASTLITLPMILVFFFAQRFFIQGIVMTGMKG